DYACAHLRQNTNNVEFGNAHDFRAAVGGGADFAAHFHRRAALAADVGAFAEHLDLVRLRIEAPHFEFGLVVGDTRSDLHADGAFVVPVISLLGDLGARNAGYHLPGIAQEGPDLFYCFTNLKTLFDFDSHKTLA